MSEPQRRESVEIARRTSLSEKEIKELVGMGLSKDDIYICYTAREFVSYSMKDIARVYLDEDKDLDLFLKDLDIPREEFEERYQRLFPPDENPVRRANVPWLKAPYRW